MYTEGEMILIKLCAAMTRLEQLPTFANFVSSVLSSPCSLFFFQEYFNTNSRRRIISPRNTTVRVSNNTNNKKMTFKKFITK